MKIRTTGLLALATVVSIATAGCAADDTTTPDGDPSTAPQSEQEQPDDEPSDVDSPPSGDDAASAGEDGETTQPADVALSFDGQQVPVATACNGVDGAVLVTTEGEVTITLVQEEGTALRYDGEGMLAETADVEVETIDQTTIYTATLASDQVPAVDVALEITDTTGLPECPA